MFLCVTKFAETLLTRFENLENCYFLNSPQTRNSVTPREHMDSNTLAMMSKCFSIASLMSTHFHPELDPIITTLPQFIDFVVMNQQHEDIVSSAITHVLFLPELAE